MGNIQDEPLFKGEVAWCPNCQVFMKRGHNQNHASTHDQLNKLIMDNQRLTSEMNRLAEEVTKLQAVFSRRRWWQR